MFAVPSVAKPMPLVTAVRKVASPTSAYVLAMARIRGTPARISSR